jgi:hypothetical protein
MVGNGCILAALMGAFRRPQTALALGLALAAWPVASWAGGWYLLLAPERQMPASGWYVR